MYPSIMTGSTTSYSEATSSKETTTAPSIRLRHHASVLNNIGAVLYNKGDSFEAMKYFHEAVNILKDVTNDDKSAFNQCLEDISNEKEEEMRRLLISLKQEYQRDSVNGGTIPIDEIEEPRRKKARASANDSERTRRKVRQLVGILPKKPPSKADGSMIESDTDSASEPPLLSFDDALEININAMNMNDSSFDMSRCSEVTMFNMALCHYRWGSLLPSMELFSLSVSLSTPQPTQAAKSTLPDVLVLASLNNMGEMYLQQGQVHDAIKVLSYSLQLDNDLLKVMGFDGIAHFISGKPTEVTQEKMPTSRCRYKPSPEEKSAFQFGHHIATIVSNLSQAYFLLEDFDKSLKLAHKTLRFRRHHHHSNERLHLSISYYNIGLIHHRKSELKHALRNFQTCLQLLAPVLGKEKNSHPFYATILHDIGKTFYLMQKTKQAFLYFAKSLGIRKRIFGPVHEDVAESLYHLGRLLHEKEQYDDALEVFSEALKVQTIVHGSHSLSVATTLSDMGRIHHATGEMDESLFAYSEVVKITRKHFGERHPHVANILNIIGNVRIENGEVREAMPAFIEAMRINLECRKRLGAAAGYDTEENPNMLMVVKNNVYNVKLNHDIMAASA